MKNAFFFLFTFFSVLTWGAKADEKLTVYDLKCENLRNPLGIDKATPHFSWKVKSTKNGTRQKAYQIVVSGSLSAIQKGEGDLWNSQGIDSPESVLVSYKGKALASGMNYYWKVRVWDEKGNASPWSQVVSFSVGLLNKEDWKAAYIGFPTDSGYRECPQLKRKFEIKEKYDKLLLHVNSLGYHEVYLNGQKVGDGVLAPAVSQFDKRSWVLTYDISSLIKKGQNELMLWLGSGWYTKGLPGVSNDGPLVKAQLDLLSADSRKTVLITDDSWVGRKSSYTRHGDWRPHRFGGEIVTGSMTGDDLKTGEGLENNWKPVTVVLVPDAAVSPQMVEHNNVAETIDAQSVNQAGRDTFLIDMGKTLTGWAEIHFSKLEKGQKITIDYSDHLDKNGKFAYQKQTDWYIASGGANEYFCNKFNYHGYRYIRIVNLHDAPASENIKGYLIRTGFEPASGFKCSDDDLNRIHDMINYTLQCLSIGGDLVDCPTLERLGYGGDGNASTLTAQTMYNLNPLYANWLQAWADCVRDDGGMPHTAPNPYKAGGGPYWCGFIITASWKTYLNYGDIFVLEKYYPVMQKWLGYVDTYSADGLLKGWPDTDYRGWYLGDWATPIGIDQKAEASVGLVNNCFVAVCLDNMERIAKVLGKTDDVAMYERRKADLQQKIHQRFFNSATNSYATATQIDLAYPMISGVVPENLTAAVTQSLVKETENRNGHLATGLVGIPVLTEWAVKNKAVDLMYSMLKKKDYPGYLYMLENGGTTTWEHWNGERSRIHNCYNGIGSWFYQAVGGIRPDENTPAYQKVIIEPQVPHGVTWAKTWKETPYGRLSLDWQMKDAKMEMNVVVPIGVNAQVVIPSEVKSYQIDGKVFTSTAKEETMVAVGSGVHSLIYSR
jgi:Alpha-L-rhamnosidase N-terminal domain./Bacterial alpha-L-rhamnosidase.